MIFRTAGATKFFNTKFSAIFDMAGVKDIGLKCLFISRTGDSLGTGVTLAHFQSGGNFCSW